MALGILPLCRTANAQIFTENAGVTSPELPNVRESLRFLETTHVSELRLDSAFTYSPAIWLETKLDVPVVSRNVDFDDAAGVKHDDDVFGLGDVSLRLKQRLHRDDGILTSDRWSLLADVVAPTGAHDEKDDGVEIPRPLQPSTGAWGMGGGTAYTIIRDRHRASVELTYAHTTPHDGFQFGDAIHWNLAYWYRLSPARFDPKEDVAEIRGVFEILTTYQFDHHQGGRSLENAGTRVWGAPGIQFYGSRNVLLEAALIVPLHEDTDDAFGSTRFGASVILKVLF